MIINDSGCVVSAAPSTRYTVPIFNTAFPGCQAVFAFDNASNHCSYAANAFRVGNMNLHPGGKQSVLREVFMHGKGLPQSMSFAQDYYNRELAGKPKGIKRVQRAQRARAVARTRFGVGVSNHTQSTRLQPRGRLLCSPSS